MPGVFGPAGLSARPAQGLTDPGGPQRESSRLPALDGLRGVASLVVLVFHVLLLSPAFAAPVVGGVRPDEASWWFTHTPLYVLWAGPQAVFLFFVLSGFVLALPATRASVRWRAYYPQRLLRLYLPVWGSLVLAAALAVLVPRTPQPALSEWYARHVPDVGPAEVLRDGFLLAGAGWLNSPLWSLQWEMWFSLLLPAYLVFARSGRRWLLPKVVLLLCLITIGARLSAGGMLYLSMFALGVLLAFERDRVARAASALAPPRRAALAFGGCVLLLGLQGLLLLVGLEGYTVRALAAPFEMLGACLAVGLALHWEPARRRLSAPWAQWVGVRSFSLYLVHEPLAVSSGALWPELPVAAHLAVVVPLSLLVAHLFHRAVEAPAHRLARAAARTCSGPDSRAGHGSLTSERSAA